MLFELFKKNGGFLLIKHYCKNHVLIYAVLNYLLIPKTKVGLEFLRTSIENKIYVKTKKKYFKNLIPCNVPNEEKKKVIWVAWFQGIDNAPPLVRTCLNSMQEKLIGYEIKIITDNNICDYTNIPNFIMDKWKNGIISNAHFSDLLRTNLLLNHGGTWIDSTVLLTSPIPYEIEKASFFVFRLQKPGLDGHFVASSSWFISSTKGHPVLQLTQNLLYDYWQKENYLKDYFLFHMFLEMSLQYYSKYLAEMPKYTNENPHLLLFELKNKFDKDIFNSITTRSFIHKLTYKLDKEVLEKDNTFYKYIINSYK